MFLSDDKESPYNRSACDMDEAIVKGLPLHMCARTCVLPWESKHIFLNLKQGATFWHVE